MDARTELATELFGTVGRFRREVRRTGGEFSIGSGLTESQAELLRLIARKPDISVREAATELGLAANTASTLVSKLSADGLLVRSVDSADRRIGRLRLTASAQRGADQSRAAKRAALRAGLDRLQDDEIDALTEGLEVMSKLTRMLAEVTR